MSTDAAEGDNSERRACGSDAAGAEGRGGGGPAVDGLEGVDVGVENSFGLAFEGSGNAGEVTSADLSVVDSIIRR